MTTAMIPNWTAQGVLPPFAECAKDRRVEQRLLAERSVLRFLLNETVAAESQRGDFLLQRLEKLEREIAAETLQAGVDESVITDELAEERQTIVGRFQGILPTVGEFEFLTDATVEPIHGYLSFSVTDSDRLNEQLNRRARIHVLVTRAADGPPCYRLVEVSEWLEDEASLTSDVGFKVKGAVHF